MRSGSIQRRRRWAIFLLSRTVFSVLTLFALLAPAPSLAAPAGDGQGWTTLPLADLGFDGARARYATEPEIGLPFASRQDRLILGGQLELTFAAASDVEVEGALGLVVLLNHEEVATLDEEALSGSRTIEIDERLFGRENLLSLRLLTSSSGACGEVPAGIWTRLASGRLRLRTAQLPVETDLSSLPLPFLDQGFEREGRISLVFARKPDAALIRLAGLAAGWLGREGGIPIHFEVSVESIPFEHAIVLVDSAEDALGLGLPAPEGPTVQVLGIPGEEPALHRLLLLSGRDPAELEAVVRRLGAGMAKTTGDRVVVEAPAPAAPAAPYDASRWLPSGRALRFSEIPGGESLVHRGVSAGTETLRFRVAPDLFFFPDEFVPLELDYAVDVPRGISAPTVDVELNGVFLGRLETRLGRLQHKAFRVHHSLLRGFNELRMHVRYPDAFCEGELEQGKDAEIRVLGSSLLHLEDAAHFRELPDIPSLIYDGFPFTRVPDLGEAALVLPKDAAPEEISAALSMVAWFASITGDPGSRLEVIDAEDLETLRPDKELLIVARSSASILRRFAERLPAARTANGWDISIPEQSSRILEWAGGLRERGERERASRLLAGEKDPGIVLGMESPFAAGRSVLILTATSLAALPDILSLQGHATSRGEGGDLFVVAADGRHSFRIGTPFHRGEIGPFTELRWILSSRWLVLLPLLFGGAAIAGFSLRPALERRARERLSVGEDRIK